MTETSQRTTTTTDYSGSFVYEFGELKQILTSEGRIIPEAGGQYSYEYFLKDHLGNTRVVFNQNGEIVQDNSYYPFGMEIESLSFQSTTHQENKYLYNGKELQDDFELDWYDYGARMYDPALARFHSVDPLAETFNAQSPYHYALNNPIRYKDFFGMGAEEKGKEEEEKRQQQTNQNQKTNEINLSDVEVTDKEGNKSTVTVKFKNTSDGESSDNEIKKDLKDAFDGAVKEAAKNSSEEITDITITATTNGKHSKTSRHSSGKALDIGGVNGKSVKDIGDADPVKALQKAFDGQKSARENFGPSMMKKSGKSYINDNLSEGKKKARKKVKKQHQDHIHWSVD
ncbi:MAG: RHS repeat-associated core domain-containing protein [Bacteroidales bacterium]|nr:RHS repeat-associated core domain-containing protein [Bacteroidales bacterium]